ncbi:MAG: helix-turn-helix transcriptional regulator [Eubacterium sp.]|nr:helix-turn-helix transcriptional regulator [Eubacterium sp.]
MSDYLSQSRNTFGDNLRKLRKEKGLTQQQLSDIVGIKRSAYAYYEIDKSEPSIATLLKIANALNVSVDEIVNSSRPVHSGAAEYSGLTDDELKTLIKLYKKLDNSQKHEVENYIRFITKEDE